MTASLSVIIASTGQFGDAVACLHAIVQQCRGRRVQIILASCSDGKLAETMATVFPDIVSICLARQAALPRLLGAALAQATGEVIAITDATCAVDEQWVSAILKAHEVPRPVIGGAVEPDGLRTLVDWAAYFCDYGQFMLPLSEGPVSEIPGNNLSIERWALARGREYGGEEFWKTYWCRRIQAEGLALYAVPSIVVYYRKSFRLRSYLLHRFHNGRCFAGMRIAQLSRLGRVLYLAGSPSLPLLFCARIFKTILSKRRYLGQFSLALPIIVLATISWALGEFVGYLSGSGTSCCHVR